MGALLIDPKESNPDDFVRAQVEAEWRRKVLTDLQVVKEMNVRAEPHHHPKPFIEILPAVISGLTVICAVIGMLWSFMLNQNTYQAINTQKLDTLGSTLAEIRKNADQVPLIAVQLQNMDVRQKQTEEQEKKNEQKLSDVSESLARMGVRTK